MSDDKLIYEFSKNTGQKVVVQLREFKGKKLIDLRVFYLTEDGSWRPTPKGISLRPELITELKRGVDKAEACVKGGDQGANKDSAARTSREERPERTEDE